VDSQEIHDGMLGRWREFHAQILMLQMAVVVEARDRWIHDGMVGVGENFMLIAV
jgi:hypothetical protein